MVDQPGPPTTDDWSHGQTARVVPAELYFDLAFVFCLVQISYSVSSDLAPLNLLRGLLMILLIWTVWVGFAWIGNFERERARLEQLSWFRILMVVTVASLIVLGMAIPEGFGDQSSIFVGAFVVISVLYVIGFLYVTRDSPATRRSFRAILPMQLVLPVSLVVSAVIDKVPWSPIVISVGLASALLATRFRGHDQWSINAEHADERFGLFIFIVLGEIIIALGFGASETHRFGPPVVVSIVCGVVFSAALWWIYFSLVASSGADRLERLSEAERARVARVVYTYLHGALVVICAFLAVGIEVATAEPLHKVEEPFNLIIPTALSLFIVTVFIIRRTLTGTFEWRLLIPAVTLLVAIPLGMWLPAIWVEVVCAGLLVFFVLGRELQTRALELPWPR